MLVVWKKRQRSKRPHTKQVEASDKVAGRKLRDSLRRLSSIQKKARSGWVGVDGDFKDWTGFVGPP